MTRLTGMSPSVLLSFASKITGKSCEIDCRFKVDMVEPSQDAVIGIEHCAGHEWCLREMIHHYARMQ